MNNSEGQYIGIQSIWLRTMGDRIQVLITIGGEDYCVINEYAPLDKLEMTISHAVTALGIREALLRSIEGYKP